MNTEAGKKQVDKALQTLGASGKLIVRRHSNGMIDSVAHPASRRHIDRTELSPQEKREASFAKGVPPYLPDNLCSEVVVSKVDQNPAGGGQGEWRYTRGAPYHETLTGCLMILRRAADESGAGYEKSVLATLMAGGNMTETQAQRAMEHLRKLGLYETTMTGYRSSSYVVNCDLETVTPEMVVEARRLFATKKQSAESPVVSVDSNPATAGDTAETVDYLSALAGIVERQETEIESLKESIVKLDEIIASVQSMNDRLREENDDLQQQVIGLNTQLAERHTVADPRVAEILSRHGITSR
ncbi:MAG: hypothetical protein WAT17_01310 [Candidatus Saccharimonadales bacterium]